METKTREQRPQNGRAHALGLHQDFKMSDCQRTLQEIHDTFKSSKNPRHYDQWADTYNSDHDRMGYKAPQVTAKALMEHLTLSPDQVRVLDVACGSGLVAKELSSSGFRQFVGVDGSQAMLDQARLTGLYQELHLALLGTQPLPVDPEEFDVVVMVGALYRKFVPVVAVRELYQATKPGGLVVITRASYFTPNEVSFTEELLREMELMEEQGLWARLEEQHVEHYMSNYCQPGNWFSGSVHMFQKSL